jgi:heptosyltransferase-2
MDLENKRILIIQTAYLGDVILTTSFIKAVRQVFKSAIIDILTIPQTADIFKHNPHIHHQLIFRKSKLHHKIPSFFSLVRQVCKNRYEIAFSIQGSLTSSLIMYFGRIPSRIGFKGQKLLTKAVSGNEGDHARIRKLHLLEKIGGSNFDTQTEIFFSEKDHDQIRSILTDYSSEQFKIGIAPGSIRNTKKWPVEYFIKLINNLDNQNMAIFLIGGTDDEALCQNIEKQSKINVCNTAGDLSLLEATALIQKLDLMITNDSAPLHMANAVKTDVLAIFGPTVRKFGFYPFREHDQVFEIDLYCRPCSQPGGRRCPEKHFRCMRDLLPEKVTKEVIKRYNRWKSKN